MRNQTRGGSFLRGLVALLVTAAAWSQTTAWQAGIAKVTTRADLNRRPGTAFVVAITDHSAFLVTAAHVVAGDPSPKVEFVADPEQRPYEAAVRNPEFDDQRGLAILVVRSVPAAISVLRESTDLPPAIGDSVTVPGFPVVLDNFSAVATTIASIKGRDIFLSQELGEGFSGGPVLREGAVLAVYYGGEQGGFGTALKSSSIRVYLKESGISWGADVPTVTETPKSATPAGPRPGEVRINLVDGLSYVWIPPGEFRMGCSPDDDECFNYEKPSHTVRISKGFWLGQTEVTQAAFKKVMGKNPSRFNGARLPVENVSWNEAREYCEAVKAASLLKRNGSTLPVPARYKPATESWMLSPGIAATVQSGHTR